MDNLTKNDRLTPKIDLKMVDAGEVCKVRDSEVKTDGNIQYKCGVLKDMKRGFRITHERLETAIENDKIEVERN